MRGYDPVVTVPSDPASEARAIASEWIAVSPDLIEVLDWHTDLCGTCRPGGGKCAEFREIISEYGAGETGAAVFFPVP